jgi:hypothetical protein
MILECSEQLFGSTSDAPKRSDLLHTAIDRISTWLKPGANETLSTGSYGVVGFASGFP